MSMVNRGLLAALALALAASPSHAVSDGGDLKVGPMLIMGGYFYMCEFNCIVTRLNTGQWTVVDERDGWVRKVPVVFIPDP